MSFINSKLNFYISFFFSIILPFSYNIEEVKISISNPYTKNFLNIEKELYILLNFQDLDTSTLSDSSYFHFETSPKDNSNPDYQQIIYSDELINNEYPSINNTEKYSYKFSYKANLFTLFPFPNKEKKSYLTIKCSKYPCSFIFKAEINKEAALLNLNEYNNFYIYNTNSLIKNKKSKIRFKFPAKESIIFEETKLMLTIINPGEKEGDYTKLYYIQNNQEYEMNTDNIKYKFDLGTIYNIEEDQLNIKEYYMIEISSSENQFISVIIKSSSIYKYEGLIKSEITPNTIPKFSFLKREESNIEECYGINVNNIIGFLDEDNEKHTLYASIEFISLPVYTYLDYLETNEVIDSYNERNSLNIIIQKKNGEYPQICFRPLIKNLEYIFMVQLNYISSKLKYNMDIYYPLFGGYLYSKILPSGSIGVYSYLSKNNLPIEKIIFYLKYISLTPQMYFFHCDDYPDCLNDIDANLTNLKNIKKADNLIEFQIYANKYNNKIKDLSPMKNTQDLLLVHCPKIEGEELCLFQIMIFSDLDEILLDKNIFFYSKVDKNDIIKYNLQIKKGDSNFKYCEVWINEDNLVFNSMQELNPNAVITKIEGGESNCYKYKFDRRYFNVKKEGIDINFSIKANMGIYFSILNFVYDIFESGKIINFDSFVFPYEINIALDDTSDYNNDLLFNFYLNDINNNINETNIIIDNILVGAVIVNQSLYEELEEKKDSNIFINNTSFNTIIQKFDKSTRSVKIKIKNKIILEGEYEPKYLHAFFYVNNLNNSTLLNKEFFGKMFVIEKENNNMQIPEVDTFISDQIIIDNQEVINLYNINKKINGIIEVKFSSNYPINDKFLFYFLKYEKNAIIDLNYCKKNYLNYTDEKIGNMHIFTLGEIKTDNIILAVISKIKKGEIDLKKINYIFKYKIYENSEYLFRPIYDINEYYNIIEEEDKIIFEFNSIKKKLDANYPKNEIYIRKINKQNRFKNESFDTFAIIESDYELIKGEKKEENNKIIITVNKTEFNKEEIYSIIYDIFDENEKFVISKFGKIEKNNPVDNNNNDLEKYNQKVELLLKIFVPFWLLLDYLF